MVKHDCNLVPISHLLCVECHQMSTFHLLEDVKDFYSNIESVLLISTSVSPCLTKARRKNEIEEHEILSDNRSQMVQIDSL